MVGRVSGKVALITVGAPELAVPPQSYLDAKGRKSPSPITTAMAASRRSERSRMPAARHYSSKQMSRSLSRPKL